MLLFALVIITSCTKGNRNVITENRDISGFDKVHNLGSFDVTIVNAPVFNVAVEAEENLLPFIRTDVSDGVLHIGVKKGHIIKPHETIKVNVHMPVLKGIELSGSGNIICDTFDIEQMDIDISGSGNISLGTHATSVNSKISGSGEITITGSATNANLSISGSGQLHALDMVCINCNADIAGSGSIYVNVTTKLDAHISGSGDIYYSGNPQVNTHISGSGKVIHY